MDAQEQRRLLELAARAVGYDVSRRLLWRPHEDDGDALRLAVDLRLRLVLTEHGCGASRGEIHRLVALDEVDSVHEATRLAIVRAAAAVGERMNAAP